MERCFEMTNSKTNPQIPATCTVVQHPVLEHKLRILRDTATQASTFRGLMGEIASLLAYEATRDLETSEAEVSTPLEATTGREISEDLILVSILRAGDGMLQGMLQMLPFARVGHVGIYRDKFIDNTVEYFFRIPDSAAGKRVILVDPLLATGDTAVAAVDRLKEFDVGPIQFVCVLAAPEGLAQFSEAHPDVSVLTVSVERELNDLGYILPGLGDAGDRLFGTI